MSYDYKPLATKLPNNVHRFHVPSPRKRPSLPNKQTGDIDNITSDLPEIVHRKPVKNMNVVKVDPVIPGIDQFNRCPKFVNRHFNSLRFKSGFRFPPWGVAV